MALCFATKVYKGCIDGMVDVRGKCLFFFDKGTFTRIARKNKGLTIAELHSLPLEGARRELLRASTEHDFDVFLKRKMKTLFYFLLSSKRGNYTGCLRRKYSTLLTVCERRACAEGTSHERIPPHRAPCQEFTAQSEREIAIFVCCVT